MSVKSKIETMIYTIRGLKVMLDSDLAKLYGVETRILNQAVKRNQRRFPEDFMFLCDIKDLECLRSQFVTAKHLTNWNFKRRTIPMLFTENGIAMLSSVLSSELAIDVNIEIMRTFTEFRKASSTSKVFETKLTDLQKGTKELFNIVFERLDEVDQKLDSFELTLTPRLPANRKKIGLK